MRRRYGSTRLKNLYLVHPGIALPARSFDHALDVPLASVARKAPRSRPEQLGASQPLAGASTCCPALPALAADARRNSRPQEGAACQSAGLADLAGGVARAESRRLASSPPCRATGTETTTCLNLRAGWLDLGGGKLGLKKPLTPPGHNDALNLPLPCRTPVRSAAQVVIAWLVNDLGGDPRGEDRNQSLAPTMSWRQSKALREALQVMGRLLPSARQWLSGMQRSAVGARCSAEASRSSRFVATEVMGICKPVGQFPSQALASTEPYRPIWWRFAEESGIAGLAPPSTSRPHLPGLNLWKPRPVWAIGSAADSQCWHPLVEAAVAV